VHEAAIAPSFLSSVSSLFQRNRLSGWVRGEHALPIGLRTSLNLRLDFLVAIAFICRPRTLYVEIAWYKVEGEKATLWKVLRTISVGSAENIYYKYQPEPTLPMPPYFRPSLDYTLQFPEAPLAIAPHTKSTTFRARLMLLLLLLLYYFCPRDYSP
jgi:hypothetical protein